MFNVVVNRSTIIARKARSIKNQGFTLVEIIVGLVLSSVAISLVATLIFPLYERSVGPVFQIRAAELAQSILDDALSYRYDEASPLGGSPACSAVTVPPCSTTMGFDAGESAREDIDDVDDFNFFCGSTFRVEDILRVDISAEYSNYFIEVCVGYDGNYNAVLNEANEINAKLITVTVTPPQQASIVSVSAYRGNY